MKLEQPFQIAAKLFQKENLEAMIWTFEQIDELLQAPRQTEYNSLTKIIARHAFSRSVVGCNLVPKLWSKEHFYEWHIVFMAVESVILIGYVVSKKIQIYYSSK